MLGVRMTAKGVRMMTVSQEGRFPSKAIGQIAWEARTDHRKGGREKPACQDRARKAKGENGAIVVKGRIAKDIRMRTVSWGGYICWIS